MDLVTLAAAAFQRNGLWTVTHGDYLEVPGTGFVLQPRLVEMRPTPDGVQTATTVQVNHPSRLPEGLFEFQHSVGPDAATCLKDGFEQWYRLDFVTILDAGVQSPTASTVMNLDSRSPGRRVTLGPVGHLSQQPVDERDEHPFCPCCLLTNSFDAFAPQFTATGVQGVRLFAMRDADGGVSADCRVNGEDYEPGAAALREYVQQWPDRGAELRKQYILFWTA